MGNLLSGEAKKPAQPQAPPSHAYDAYNYHHSTGQPARPAAAPVSRPSTTTTPAFSTLSKQQQQQQHSAPAARPVPTSFSFSSSTQHQNAAAPYYFSSPQQQQPRPAAAAAAPSAFSTAVSAYRQTLKIVAADDNDGLSGALSRLTLDSGDSWGATPVYVLSLTAKKICAFIPARDKIVTLERAACPEVERDALYLADASARRADERVAAIRAPTAARLRNYQERPRLIYSTLEAYEEFVLPALLLGSRVRDYEQRCAVVVQTHDLIVTMPQQPKRIKELKLRTDAGCVIEVKVDSVLVENDRQWRVSCTPLKGPLPAFVHRNCLLEVMNVYARQPVVTEALVRAHHRQHPIENWRLLRLLYGDAATQVHGAINGGALRRVGMKDLTSATLNAEQAEAVARYNSDCPGFVVEAPPGSGKTMTAAAMAVSYNRGGVQLFLSTANVPVFNMALALAKLDYGHRRAIHYISSEREEMMASSETRSPFSVLELARASSEDVANRIDELERQAKLAPNEEERNKINDLKRKLCAPLLAKQYDIMFATVDMIIGKQFKPNNKRAEMTATKRQLLTEVSRVVIDEASQLTEAALNAIIFCFPEAQIVLIGDSKQLPPFKFCEQTLVARLAARSALEVAKNRMNLPVIRLTKVYRASKELIAHYSDAFYGGTLVSCKPHVAKNVLGCFGARAGAARCLFWTVKGGVSKQAGTSKVNEAELGALSYIINILKNSGHDEKSVMIISYYEAQRKRAEERLPKGYEVLTIDSAQGREKKIVIVLTTRTSVPTDEGAFFTCPLRCNVATSRHQEALIVLGHASIAVAPSWSRVLSTKYFKQQQ